LLVREPGIGTRVETPRADIVRRLYLGRIRYSLWWHFASVHVSEKIINSLEAKPISDYFTDPVLLNTQFRKASDLVTEELLSKM
jgi:hypothetical protein